MLSYRPAHKVRDIEGVQLPFETHFPAQAYPLGVDGRDFPYLATNVFVHVGTNAQQESP